MKAKNKLYMGWLIGAAFFLAASIILFILSFQKGADEIPKRTISPEVTAEITKYGVDTSTLPVVYVNTDSGHDISYAYTPSSVTIINSFSKAEVEYEGSAQLKLRGNSTIDRPKKPYKLKLETKSDLFGMGSSKHWVLLANDIDHTFIRNKLVYDFYNDIGGDYACESLNVILILNGNYQGVYQLCEQIRIEENRVDIFDWEELAKEAADIIAKEKKKSYGLSDEEAKEFETSLEEALTLDFSWITSPYELEYDGITYHIDEYVDIPEATGGFILEMDFYNNNLPPDVSLKTAFQQPFYFSDPNLLYTNKTIKEYADKYIQSFEYALHSDDFFFRSDDVHYTGVGERFSWNSLYWYRRLTTVNYSDPLNEGKHYTELFDLDSLVNNFWVCEFSMNWDSMKNSTFVTKDIGELAKIAPVWDFDWAFGNNNMYNIDTNIPNEWHTTNDYFTNEQYYQAEQWNRYLIKDPYFLLKAYEKYKEIRPTVIEDIIKTDGKLRDYYNLYKEDGKANDLRWSSTYMSYNGQVFNSAFASLRSFIRTRISFIDSQCTSFDSFVSSLGYYEKSSFFDIINIHKNSDDTVIITGKTTSPKALKLSFQVNGKNLYQADIEDGMAAIIVPSSILEDDGSNIVVIRGIDKNGDYIYPSADTSARTYNPDHVEPLSNYKVF